MVCYDDVFVFGQLMGSVLDISLVWCDNFKVGVGIGGEQQINDDIGVFVCVFWVDGKMEIYVFMEIDCFVLFGMLVKGSQWGCLDDMVGLVVVINMLLWDYCCYLQ